MTTITGNGKQSINPHPIYLDLSLKRATMKRDNIAGMFSANSSAIQASGVTRLGRSLTYHTLHMTKSESESGRRLMCLESRTGVTRSIRVEKHC